MKNGELCNRDVITIKKSETVLEAARRMKQYNVGTLVVIEEEGGNKKPIGIMTDRDIVIKVIAESLHAVDFLVVDLMSDNLVTVHENEDVFDTLQKMRDRGVRRVPVVDQDGHLMGILAMTDLLEFFSEEMRALSVVSFGEGKREGFYRA